MVQPSPEIILDARFAAQASARDQLPPPVHVEIAFAGRSNVGKSSLLNRLMNRRNLARTSSTPGCTRGITFFEVALKDGPRLTLVDLPGYGYAQRSKQERIGWGHLIDDYLTGRPGLLAVALLVDARRGVEEDDLGLLELLTKVRPPKAPPKPVLIATKLDKVPRPQRVSVVKGVARPDLPAVGFSTELAETTSDVWRKLRAIVG
jgi:GTP-binding protein